jgi:hypothetical protein
VTNKCNVPRPETACFDENVCDDINSDPLSTVFVGGPALLSLASLALFGILLRDLVVVLTVFERLGPANSEL